MPLVSVCIPTYMRARHIGETLRSVLAQTLRDIEVIVVDDASPDATGDVVRFVRDERVRYHRNERNAGVPENYNRAFALARGEFLVLVEDHDVLEPTYLEETVSLLEAHPAMGFAATGIVTIDEDGVQKEWFVESGPSVVPGARLLRRLLTGTDCPFSLTAVVRRRSLEGLEPYFDPRYWWYADQHLWLRLAARSDFGYVPKPLLRFRDRERDHVLANRGWDSLLCVDRIHADDWTLLHPRPSLRAAIDRCRYGAAKTATVAGIRAGAALRGEPWGAEDAAHARRYLPGAGRALVAALGLLPPGLVSMLRRLYHSQRRRRTAPAGHLL